MYIIIVVKGNRPDMPNDGTDSHTASPNTKSPLASTDPSPSPSPGPNAAPGVYSSFMLMISDSHGNFEN